MLMDMEPEDKPYTRRGTRIDVQGLNSDMLADTRQIAPLVSGDGINPQLSVKQIRALNCLLTQGLTETIAEVSARAGVSPRTIYRYMQSSEFMREYRRLCTQELSVHRAAVTKALIKGACTRGPAQPAMAKLYFERLGEPVVEHTENVNTNRREGLDIDGFSMSLKRCVVDEIEARERGEDVRHWTYQLVKNVGPQPMLPQATRNVTPLEEVELP